jgi:hypothetical protein
MYTIFVEPKSDPYGANLLGECSNVHLTVTIRKRGAQHRSANATASTAKTIADLANKHGCRLRAIPFGYAFETEKNVAFAIWYLTSFWRTSGEELQRIIRTGKAPFIEFWVDIVNGVAKFTGDPDITGTSEPFALPLYAHGKDAFLSIAGGPHLMKLTWQCKTTVTLDYENVGCTWLKRVLEKGLTGEEQKMMDGTSMLGSNAQRRLGSKLSKLALELGEVAKSLVASASKTSDAKRRDQMISWLTVNGFQNEAAAVVIKSTLITRQPPN